MHVSDVIGTKGSRVITIDPGDTIADTVDLLHEHQIGAIVASPDGRRIAGIISERDIVRHLVREQEHTLRLRVEDLMTEGVTSCLLSDTIDAVMNAMTEGRFRHCPVTDETGMLTGLVSMGDLVKHRLGELEAINLELREYIKG